MRAQVHCIPVPGIVFVENSVERNHAELISRFNAIAQEFDGNTGIQFAFEAIDVETRLRKANKGGIRSGLKEAGVLLLARDLCVNNEFNFCNETLLMYKLVSDIISCSWHLITSMIE